MRMTGQTLSHYEVLEKLGAGGMGVVYKARDLTLDRFVALKFLAAHLNESDPAEARFRREARSISALNHPNIATIYEVGEAAGEPFLAFEYIPGGTLESRLASLRASGTKMSLDEVISIATQLAEGLAHAHRNGILHRDIKPGNLMFSAEGLLKIMDFGLSKLLSASGITPGGNQARHAVVHVAGAGRRPPRRSALRYLLLRRRAVRDAGGRTAVPR